MSQFVECGLQCYTYNRNGEKHIIMTDMLIFLFKTFGYYVDPGDRSGAELSPSSIAQLERLAQENGDHTLTRVIRELSTDRCNGMELRKHQCNRELFLPIFKMLFNIGLYLGGWKGDDEPYICAIKNIRDNIRMELKIAPLVESLNNDPNYFLVKDYPTLEYYRRCIGSHVVYTRKNSLTIGECIDTIGAIKDYKQVASYLISTSHYYITVIYKMPLPLVEKLISSLTLIT